MEECFAMGWFIGFVCGYVFYRSSYTTPEEREKSRIECVKRTADLEEKIKVVNELEKRVDKIIRR